MKKDSDVAVSSSQELASIIHQLAGVKKETRDAGLDSLTQHLKLHGQDMDTLDYARLWQGLLTCFWLTDMEYVQHQVARRIARLIHVIPSVEKEDAAFRFIRTFYTSIVEYWAKNVDMHRVAKYMSLIRYFLHESFLFLRYRCRYQYIGRFNAAIKDGPLLMHSGKYLSSLSVMTHVIDIFAEEAEKALAHNESGKIYAVDEDIDYGDDDMVPDKDSVGPISAEDFIKLLQPFFEVYATISIDSVIVAFDKGLWRQLLEYKELDLDMADAVRREKLLEGHKKGAYVTAGLYNVQHYARSAKGALNVDLGAIAAKFLEHSKRKRTKNKSECIKWHGKFDRAQIGTTEDPLAIFKEELTSIQKSHTDDDPSENKAQGQRKSALMDMDDEDDDAEQEEFSDDNENDSQSDISQDGDNDDDHEGEMVDIPVQQKEQLASNGDDSDDDDDDDDKKKMKKRRKFGKTVGTKKTEAHTAPSTSIEELGVDQSKLRELLKKIKTTKGTDSGGKSKKKNKKKTKNGEKTTKDADTNGKALDGKSAKRVSFELSRNEVKVYKTNAATTQFTDEKTLKQRKLKNSVMKPKKVKNKMRSRMEKRRAMKNR